jgi:hypothetical protein
MTLQVMNKKTGVLLSWSSSRPLVGETIKLALIGVESETEAALVGIKSGQMTAGH